MQAALECLQPIKPSHELKAWRRRPSALLHTSCWRNSSKFASRGNRKSGTNRPKQNMDPATIFLFLFIAAGTMADVKVDESNRYVDKLLSTTFPHYGGVLGYSYLDGFTIKINMKSGSNQRYTSVVTRNPRLHVARHEGYTTHDVGKPVHSGPDYARPNFDQPDYRGRGPGDQGTFYSPGQRNPYHTASQVWDHSATATAGNNGHHARGKRSDKVVAKEIKVHFKEGWLSGLDRMKRLGNCSWPWYQLGNLVMSCYVYLEGFQANYEGDITAESLIHASDGKVNVTGTLKNTIAFIEFMALPETQVVSAWAVLPYKLKVGFSRLLGSEHKKILQKEIEKVMKRDVTDYLYGPLKRGLEKAVKTEPLPTP